MSKSPWVKTPVEPKDATLADMVAGAVQRLEALIETYDNPGTRYLSQPRPDRAPRFSDYAQLARVAEWAGADETDGEPDGGAGGGNGDGEAAR